MLLPRSLGPELERLSSTMSAVYSCRPITHSALVVLPRTPATRLSQLPPVEAADLFATGAAACAAAEGASDGFNWSIKDSWSLSGSSTEQLHLHIVPRAAPTKDGMFCRDFRESDHVYEQLDQWHPEPGVTNTPPAKDWPDDSTRTARTAEDMAAEAMTLREVQAGGCDKPTKCHRQCPPAKCVCCRCYLWCL